jgi:hypothetical protein
MLQRQEHTPAAASLAAVLGQVADSAAAELAAAQACPGRTVSEVAVAAAGLRVSPLCTDPAETSQS